MEAEKKDEWIIHKIDTKSWYKVFKNCTKGRDYFKIMVEQKNYDGTTKKYYKNIGFKRTLETPKDGDIIRIKQAIVNYYGEDKYHPSDSITVLDYESKKSQERIDNEAFNEFGKRLDAQEDIGNIVIVDDDLPF